ncbi:MAG: NapC/NirT family cytochrome c [Nitrospirota bacterium]
MKERLPQLASNWISAVGALAAVVSIVAIVFLLTVNFFRPIASPYLGIVLYLFLPFFLAGGLLLIPLGMYRKWRTWQKTGEMPYFKWPSVDLNKPRHRNAALVFFFGTLVFVLISMVVTYQAYHYTDSVVFCGETCHRVMKPEYTAYQHSPHARVKCVSCHIGPGAGWYARSKLQGLYQVYAVLADVYPRPIPTPLEDLRPARETCEECHWPSHFFGARQRRFDHYLYNRDNTHWPITMLIKVGGGLPGTLQPTGIHWHVNEDIRIEYIARDRQRQDIPWVRVVNKRTGAVTVYEDAGSPLSKEAVAAAKPRVMDCIDCHNRPSHRFLPPDYAVDLALASGRIDPSIPEIKRNAVNAMALRYRSEAEAMEGIARTLTDTYRTVHPGFSEKNAGIIAEAVESTQALYRDTIFPHMNARWSVYPNHIGHFYFRGCMRCHDGNHKNESGVAITGSCTACHLILSQGRAGGAVEIDLESGIPFRHPADIGDVWKSGACYECHNGIQP